MRMKVTDQGITLPKRLLGGAAEVEVCAEGGKVTVLPVLEDDPISGLGRDPVSCDAPDGAERHDQRVEGSRAY